MPKTIRSDHVPCRARFIVDFVNAKMLCRRLHLTLEKYFRVQLNVVVHVARHNCTVQRLACFG